MLSATTSISQSDEQGKATPILLLTGIHGSQKSLRILSLRQ